MMQVPNDGPLLVPGEIDWDALMRDMSPPEWDLLLSATAKNDQVQVRSSIEEQGVPVTHSNAVGQTALHIACLWGHESLVRYLIEKGADVNATNNLTGATPLHMTLTSSKMNPAQQARVAEILVNVGNARTTIEDNFGKAPLEYIVGTGKRTHPLYCSPQHATLLARLKPPPPGEDRLRASFVQQIMRDLPGCSVAPK